MGGVNIPLEANNLQPQQPVDPLQEQIRAATLAQTAAQTQGIQQQNQAGAMQLKDETLRRSLAPQFVQKDAKGNITGYDNEGLYGAMLAGGADPTTITKMRTQQIELQKSLLGLNDAALSHSQKIAEVMGKSLESIQDIQDKEKKAAPAASTPPAPSAAAQNVLPNQIPMAAAANPAPGATPEPIGASPAGTPESLSPPPAGSTPTPTESAATSAAANAPRPITPGAQKAYHQALVNLAGMGMDISKLPPGLNDESDLETAMASIGQYQQIHKDHLADQETIAKTKESLSKGAQADSEAQAALWKPAGEGTLVNVQTNQLIHGVASPDIEAFKSYIAKGGDPAGFPAWKAQQVSQAEAPVRIATAQAEGISRANIEAQIARGSNAALAQVPPHLVAPASAAATKAGEDYAQAQSVSQRLEAMMKDAEKGNVVSYQLLPQEGALQLTTSQGVHRINMAEIQNYGGGSLWQKMEGHIGKALTGESIPQSVLDDMKEMQKIQAEGSQTKYNNALKTINTNYGSTFNPVEMSKLPRNEADFFSQFGGKAKDQ